jgi:hypothetical protein
MALNISQSSERFLEHFHEHGWVRLCEAFDAQAARSMRDAVWHALEHMGVDRDRPSTWTVERPSKLQALKGDPLFQKVGSSRE